jgi:hypothetical protein
MSDDRDDTEVERLRNVCAEAYQLAGTLGGSVEAMDNLAAAAAGEPLPHESFLPVGMAVPKGQSIERGTELYRRQFGPTTEIVLVMAAVGIVLSTVLLIGGSGWLIWYLWHYLS